MARHPKQAQYERTARQRQLLSMQAVAFGWTKLDTLDAYLTGDGELVVIDKELNRYATTAEAADLISPETPLGSNGAPLVAPADVPAEEFGPKWQKGRKRIAQGVFDLDLSGKDRGEALALFEQGAATMLRAVELLREHTGPDWREAIGLTEDSS